MVGSHVGVSYIEGIETQPFETFSREIAHDLLNMKCEARPEPEPFACLEWLMPTAVVVFITKPYFESFLQEAGKDHYHILKASISKLFSQFTKDKGPIIITTSTNGKVVEKDLKKYSLVYSVVSDLGDGLSAKLLLQPELTLEETNRAVAAFLEFLSSVHDQSLDPDAVTGLRGARPIGRTLLVAFNTERSVLEIVDPLPNHVRKKA